MNYFELIEKYLSDELSHHDRLDFERELLANEQLATDVEIQREIESFGQLDAMVTSQMERLRKPKQQVTKTPIKVHRPKPWQTLPIRAVATAVIALLLVGVLLFDVQQSKTLDNLLTNPIYAQEKGEVDVNNQEKSIADYFNVADFDHAIPMLSKKIKLNPKDFHAMLYLGISYCDIDKPQEAQKYFDLIINGNSLNKDEARYYKAACMIKHNNSTQAKKVLTELINQSKPEKRITSKAKRLLESL